MKMKKMKIVIFLGIILIISFIISQNFFVYCPPEDGCELPLFIQRPAEYLAFFLGLPLILLFVMNVKTEFSLLIAIFSIVLEIAHLSILATIINRIINAVKKQERWNMKNKILYLIIFILGITLVGIFLFFYELNNIPEEKDITIEYKNKGILKGQVALITGNCYPTSCDDQSSCEAAYAKSTCSAKSLFRTIYIREVVNNTNMSIDYLNLNGLNLNDDEKPMLITIITPNVDGSYFAILPVGEHSIFFEGTCEPQEGFETYCDENYVAFCDENDFECIDNKEYCETQEYCNDNGAIELCTWFSEKGACVIQIKEGQVTEYNNIIDQAVW